MVFAQFFAYLKAKQAQQDATDAGKKAEVEKQRATDSANAANFALQQLLRAQTEQASIRKEISSATGSTQALAAIQKTLNAKRIYLQYVGDALPLAQTVGANLKNSGYAVPGYEKVDPNKSPSKNQVRYFYPEDKPESDKIAGLLKWWVTGEVESKLLSNPNNIVPQGQFEVWIAAGSTGTMSPQIPLAPPKSPPD